MDPVTLRSPRSAETLQAVLDVMDEATDVVTLFRDENLGCKQAVESAITWFLSHEAESIILEDDCVPSLSPASVRRVQRIVPRFMQAA